MTLETPRGSYRGGEWVDLPARDTIRAVVQAATQQDIAEFGLREKVDGDVRIWTLAELRTIDDEQSADAQRIVTPEGIAYRIVKVGRRSEAGFTRAIGRLFHDRGRSI